MQTLRYSQHIDAPREKVWHAMLDEATYREWTAPFSPDPSSQGYFEGSWEQGSEIRFLGKDQEGKVSGMLGTITESRPNEHVTITYRGQVINGVEDTESEEAKSMVGSTESYTLADEDGGTRVDVELAGGWDMPEDMMAMFQAAWPKALGKLKEIAERA